MVRRESANAGFARPLCWERTRVAAGFAGISVINRPPRRRDQSEVGRSGVFRSSVEYWLFGNPVRRRRSDAFRQFALVRLVCVGE